MKKKIQCLLMFLLLWTGYAFALDALERVTPVPVDTVGMIRVSWLTCSPGEEIYELYGHSAVRVCTDERDMVFNYGVFNFKSKNFIWNFVLGNTDYELAPIPYYIFEKEYRSRGSYVVEQVVNLTHEEKVRLIELLMENYQPANRVYRYNYFYDNCTTRARDIVEAAIDGTVHYPQGEGKSYREIIHEYTLGHPWAQLGNDLLLGAEADQPLEVRQEMFAPFYFMGYADRGVIEKDGAKRPLLCSTQEIIHPGIRTVNTSLDWFTPAVAGTILLLFALLVMAVEYAGNRIYYLWDIVLSLLQGVAGCLVAFMFFFSTHPTVGSNWQIILFNPLPLFFLWNHYSSLKKRQKQVYFAVYGVILLLFLLFLWAIPQKFDIFVVLLALILFTRSCSRIIWQRRNRI